MCLSFSFDLYMIHQVIVYILNWHSVCTTLSPKLLHVRRPPPRKIIVNVSVDDVQLKKSENAWKPGMKREGAPDDPEALKTQVWITVLLLLLSMCVNIHSKSSTQDMSCTLQFELDGCHMWMLLFLSGTGICLVLWYPSSSDFSL